MKEEQSPSDIDKHLSEMTGPEILALLNNRIVNRNTDDDELKQIADMIDLIDDLIEGWDASWRLPTRRKAIIEADRKKIIEKWKVAHDFKLAGLAAVFYLALWSLKWWYSGVYVHPVDGAFISIFLAFFCWVVAAGCMSFDSEPYFPTIRPLK